MPGRLLEVMGIRRSLLAAFLLFTAAAAAAAGEAPTPETKPDTAAALPPVRVRLATLGCPLRVTLRAAGKLTLTDSGTGESIEPPSGPLVVSACGGKQVRIGEHS